MKLQKFWMSAGQIQDKCSVAAGGSFCDSFCVHIYYYINLHISIVPTGYWAWTMSRDWYFIRWYTIFIPLQLSLPGYWCFDLFALFGADDGMRNQWDYFGGSSLLKQKSVEIRKNTVVLDSSSSASPLHAIAWWFWTFALLVPYFWIPTPSVTKKTTTYVNRYSNSTFKREFTCLSHLSALRRGLYRGIQRMRNCLFLVLFD